MGKDERDAGDVADLAGTGGDVLEGAPVAGEQGEPAFTQAAQRAEHAILGVPAGIEFLAPVGYLTRVCTPMTTPSYPESARVGNPVAAAWYKAGRAWMRAAVRSWTEPGSVLETHSGNPPGANRHAAVRTTVLGTPCMKYGQWSAGLTGLLDAADA